MSWQCASAQGARKERTGKMLVYQRIAQLADAWNTCKEKQNTEWQDKHEDSIVELADNYLPRGSGFDAGTTVDLDASRHNRLVLNTSYQHMDESGYYCGWSDHSIIITPSLAHGFDLRITGRDVRDIKDYMAEVFDFMLRESID